MEHCVHHTIHTCVKIGSIKEQPMRKGSPLPYSDLEAQNAYLKETSLISYNQATSLLECKYREYSYKICDLI